MPSAASNIEGKWAMIRAELSGERAPDLVAQKTELELKDGTYTVRFDGQIMDRGTYELGHTAEHTTITLKGESGPNGGRTVPCIYQLTGNRMRICYGLENESPAGFTTTTQQQRYLASYRRNRD